MRIKFSCPIGHAKKYVCPIRMRMDLVKKPLVGSWCGHKRTIFRADISAKKMAVLDQTFDSIIIGSVFSVMSSKMYFYSVLSEVGLRCLKHNLSTPRWSVGSIWGFYKLVIGFF